jgi:hypothetical protein
MPKEVGGTITATFYQGKVMGKGVSVTASGARYVAIS